MPKIKPTLSLPMLLIASEIASGAAGKTAGECFPLRRSIYREILISTAAAAALLCCLPACLPAWPGLAGCCATPTRPPRHPDHTFWLSSAGKRLSDDDDDPACLPAQRFLDGALATALASPHQAGKRRRRLQAQRHRR